MNVAVLSTVFKQQLVKEVEADLVAIATTVIKAMKAYGHKAKFFDIDQHAFEKLRRSNFDIAFNVCEQFNGNSLLEPHVPAMLEMLNIPYTGSGPLTLATCMNKVRVKEVMIANGIPTPDYQLFRKGTEKLAKHLRYPLFIKPLLKDNSIGITNESIVQNEHQLRNRVKHLIDIHQQPILAESYMGGLDVEAGVLGNGADAMALPLISVEYENLPKDIAPILSYDAKWNKKSRIYNGAEYVYDDDPKSSGISRSAERKMQQMALIMCELLDIKDYGRIDIRFNKETQEPYVLEMNPNPGISADCSTPFAAETLNISNNEMINRILYHAMKRYNMIKPNVSFKKLFKSVVPEQPIPSYEVPA
jgi:D-alanine-D-alanine ligase